MNDKEKQKSFSAYRTLGMALDPIHVGTGGSHLGRVDNSIVRDPVTNIPKIPGSSLAGVHRAYAAMGLEEGRDPNLREKPFYPDCAGQGQSKGREHCGDQNCPICSTFGHAMFAGLAAFSDAHILLFPVPTREGPVWVTSPSALDFIRIKVEANGDAVYRISGKDLNLGWLMLPGEEWVEGSETREELENLGIPVSVMSDIILVSDKMFTHVINSNLEVRTSVAIDPETGAAEDGALFTYEALPRSTVLVWNVTCRNPSYFGREGIADPYDTVKNAYRFLEALGVGGMGTRGMGRLRVLKATSDSAKGLASETPALGGV